MADFYHIGINRGDIPEIVFLPGDPARARYISGFFDESRFLASKREFTTYTGSYKGIPMGVTSTGIGGPSAAIAVEELAQAGAKIFIRIGTGGSIQEYVKVGELVNVIGAVRDEGTSRQYVPVSYPAVANIDIAYALRKSAIKQGFACHTGIIHCKDAFYIEEPSMLPDENRIKQKWETWRKAGVLSTSMESATIYTVASIRKLRAGAILGIIGETHSGLPVNEDVIKDTVDKAIMTAIEAAVYLAEKNEDSDTF